MFPDSHDSGKGFCGRSHRTSSVTKCVPFTAGKLCKQLLGHPDSILISLLTCAELLAVSKVCDSRLYSGASLLFAYICLRDSLVFGTEDSHPMTWFMTLSFILCTIMHGIIRPCIHDLGELLSLVAFLALFSPLGVFALSFA
jgi:hypothetical protein